MRQIGWGNLRLGEAFGFRGLTRKINMKNPKPADANPVQGEGDYKAARNYRREIDSFLKNKGGDIPNLAKDAEKAVDGPEGAELAQAEQKGKSKARH
jgi:hypothetical protein